MLMEASRLPRALEGRSIPGTNLFHHPNSPSNSRFFRSALCNFLIGDQKLLAGTQSLKVRTKYLKSCLAAEWCGLGCVLGVI